LESVSTSVSYAASANGSAVFLVGLALGRINTGETNDLARGEHDGITVYNPTNLNRSAR
jgi:hypothetical protein